MQTRPWIRLAFVAVAAAIAASSHAQTATESDTSCPRTREEVRDECVAWMKAHRWDEASSDWVRKSDGKSATDLPLGVTTREQIRKERNAFLKRFRWNNELSRWERIGGTPPPMSSLTRQEVRDQTIAFLRTHRWDEAAGRYVDKQP